MGHYRCVRPYRLYGLRGCSEDGCFMEVEAQKILSLIESVDPNDTAALDEIDILVHFYLAKEVQDNGKHIFLNGLGLWGVRKSHLEKPELFRKGDGWIETSELFICGEFYKYTRSRDALKAIRPNGWLPYLTSDYDGTFVFSFVDGNNTRRHFVLHSKKLTKEELAELHAIVQVIAYQRTKNISGSPDGLDAFVMAVIK